MADEAADRGGVLRDIFGLLQNHVVPVPAHRAAADRADRIGGASLRRPGPGGDPRRRGASHGLRVPGVLAGSPTSGRCAPTRRTSRRSAPTCAWWRQTRSRRGRSWRRWSLTCAWAASRSPTARCSSETSRSLLAAPIEPVYVEVTHLLRLLPVYFTEIGSEGTAPRGLDPDRRGAAAAATCSAISCASRATSNATPTSSTSWRRSAGTGRPASREPLRGYVPPSLFASLDPERTRDRGHPRRVRGTRAADGIAAASVRLRPGRDPTHRRRRHGRGPHRPGARRAARADVARDPPQVRTRPHRHRRPAAPVPARRYRRRSPTWRPPSPAATPRARWTPRSTILEALQAIMLHPGEIHAVEDIYFKRHIAVGIPSMYGVVPGGAPRRRRPDVPPGVA